MKDHAEYFQLFLLAEQKREEENRLWGERTAAFLMGSSFLFVGVVALRWTPKFGQVAKRESRS